MTQELKLSKRLSYAASLCKDGSVADIGTDHALLPIKLVLSGHECAWASDIRMGPCEKAVENVEKFGLSDKIKVSCRAGLDGIEEFSPDNIFVCGMGGEMIASILSASNYPRISHCRLVLQPQSMQDVLRRYLSENGFEIKNELVVLDGGKFYQIISAEFTGECYELTPVEQKLGRINIKRAKEQPSDVDFAWLTFLLNSAKRRSLGRKNATVEVEDTDSELIMTIERIIEGRQNADS